MAATTKEITARSLQVDLYYVPEEGKVFDAATDKPIDSVGLAAWLAAEAILAEKPDEPTSLILEYGHEATYENGYKVHKLHFDGAYLLIGWPNPRRVDLTNEIQQEVWELCQEKAWDLVD